jgi:hypothetical protein
LIDPFLPVRLIFQVFWIHVNHSTPGHGCRRGVLQISNLEERKEVTVSTTVSYWAPVHGPFLCKAFTAAENSHPISTAFTRLLIEHLGL